MKILDKIAAMTIDGACTPSSQFFAQMTLLGILGHNEVTSIDALFQKSHQAKNPEFTNSLARRFKDLRVVIGGDEAEGLLQVMFPLDPPSPAFLLDRLDHLRTVLKNRWEFGVE